MNDNPYEPPQTPPLSHSDIPPVKKDYSVTQAGFFLALFTLPLLVSLGLIEHVSLTLKLITVVGYLLCGTLLVFVMDWMRSNKA